MSLPSDSGLCIWDIVYGRPVPKIYYVLAKHGVGPAGIDDTTSKCAEVIHHGLAKGSRVLSGHVKSDLNHHPCSPSE